MLKQGLEELGFSAELIERVLPKLNSYINELELFNSAYDLVGADTHQDIVVRHILDSLAPYSHLQNLISQAKQNSTEQIEIADVGTGGVLPGIPLAIVFDDVHFTLATTQLRSGKNSLVVRLAAAGGEVNFPGFAAQAVRHALAGSVQRFLGLLANGMQAGGIAENLIEIGQHCVNGHLAHGGSCCIVCINAHI